MTDKKQNQSIRCAFSMKVDISLAFKHALQLLKWWIVIFILYPQASLFGLSYFSVVSNQWEPIQHEKKANVSRSTSFRLTERELLPSSLFLESTEIVYQ